MNRSRRFELFHKVLVPVIHGCDPASALTVARLIANEENIRLFGLVAVQGEEALSAGAAAAQQLRRLLRSLPEGKGAQTRVSHEPWRELQELIRKLEPDLLIMEWTHAIETLGVSLDDVFSRPICDVALVRGPVDPKPKKILIPLRGGPYSELVLRLALAAEHLVGSKLNSLHIRNRWLAISKSQRRNAQKRDAAFQGISSVLEHLPEVKQNHLVTDDAGSAIVDYSRDVDLVVMGSSAAHVPAKIGFGATAQRILDEVKCGVVIVKSKRDLPIEMQSEMAGQSAISVLVDKWFAENTFHADEFTDLGQLVELKKRQGVSISVAMPALNEEKTVGKVVKTVRDALMEKVRLVDEIVLMDSGSSDSTREIAADLGIPVYIHQDILPAHGGRDGKGEALWKSLYVTRGDILLWIDTDIVNINPRFVYGLVGPLLLDPDLQFVKGFYRRPLRVNGRIQAGGGGRVTELTARPLLNLFYPELSGIVQPLSGEYGGRRGALEELTFFSGYGVETGLLIDVFEKFGLGAIGQVDLQERIHHNQPLEALSKMSFAIIQVIIRKLESRYGREILQDVNRTMKMIRYAGERFFLEVEEITELDRPPMITLPEYRRR